MTIPVELQSYAERIGFPNSETLAQIFSILFNDEQSLKIAQALPGTPEDIAEKTGIPLKEVRELLDHLKTRGAINRVLHKGDYYRLFPAMIELRDASILNRDVPQKLFELWEKLITEEMSQLIPILQEIKVPPMMRVVPIEKSVESHSSVLDVDSARRIFREAELITAIPCPCRTQARKLGRGADCPAPETAMCMQINGFAEAVLDRSLGDRLTNEEALKRIGDAEDAGLVHNVRNNVKKDMFMCNCCSCCCTGFFVMNQFGYTDAIAPSRFRAKPDLDRCTGCGTCEDRCQFNAITVNDVVSIDFDKCYGCGNCVITCPEQALTLEEVRPLEFIRVT